MIENKGYKEVSKQPRNQGKFVCKEEDPMVNLSIRIPSSMALWIETEAKRKGLSKTDVAREMLSKQIPVKEIV